jgi:hypothetical protein
MTFSSGNNAIDAIALNSWNSAPHTSALVSYSFLATVPPEATEEDATGFATLLSSQRQAVRDAFALWSNVANITFANVSDSTGNNGQIRIGTNDQTNAGSAGYSDLPGNGAAGDLVYTYFNNQDSNNTHFAQGSYGLATFIHELGHAIGLKHPGNYNGNTGSGTPPYLPTETDTTDYSVMSYNDGKAQLLDPQGDHFAATPMLYDILAVQFIYGANTQYHTGNDTYRFTNLSAPQCIWDAGGTNTFDFSATGQGATIDLHAGAFSETSPGQNNISIAFGVTIQNAIGGTGNDNIFANDGTVSINGGGGDDYVLVGSGRDTIDGGSGTDIVRFNGNQTNYTIARTSTGFSVQNKSVAGNLVTVSNVETFSFLDGNVSTGSISPNTVPVLAKALPDVYGGYGKAFSLQVPSGTFADTDAGDVLHYSASLASGAALPSWLKFDAATRTFSGTPDLAGTATVRVTATDNGGLAVSNDFHVSTVVNFGQQFTATAANDQINGSNQFDAVVYDGNRANYTIVRSSATSYSVTQAGGSTDVLTNIDRLKFADATVAIDISGHAGQVYGMYQAAFNRTPDAGGLGFWINSIDVGTSIYDIAHDFISSTEFITTYSNLNTADYVSLIYQNVLHRASDPGGQAFWEAGLNSGATTRERVLLNFTDSIEFQNNLVTAVGNGFTYTPWLA